MAAIGVAALLTLLLRHYVTPTPFAFAVATVAVVAWYGGLGPGLLVVLLGSLAGGLIFPELLASRRIYGVPVPGISIATFVFTGVFVAIVIAELRTARDRAEAEERRSSFLARAGAELARSLDYEATLRRTTGLAVPALADWCAIFVLDEDGQIRLAGVASTNSGTEATINDLVRYYSTDPTTMTRLAEIVRTGLPRFIPDVSDSLLQSIALGAEDLRLLRSLATRSVVAAALVARGHTIGAMLLGNREHDRHFDPADLGVAEALAQRLALAMDNARLYQAAEAAVRRQDEAIALLDTLLSRAPIGLGFLSRDFQFVRLNETLAEMIGPPEEQVLGRTVASMLPQLWPMLEPLLRRVLETGVPAINVEVNGETIAAPGVWRSWLVSYYLVRVHQTEALGIGVVVMEITERKRAEAERERLVEQLAAEQRWLRAVIERSPVGVILVEGAAGQRIVANERAQELLGRSTQPDGGVAQYAGEFYDLDGTPRAYENLPGVRAFRGETIGPEELVLRRPDETQVPVLVTAAPIRNGDDQILGAVVVFEDISTLKELERLREEWTSIVAHDLRQPVTIISGYADRLRRQLQRPAPLSEQQESVEHIRVSASNLNRMIADLLDISRIESRHLTLERQAVDLPSLVRAVIGRAAPATEGHRVRVEIEDSIPPIEVDPGRSEQILGNLLSNAAKYGYPGADIVVRVKRQGGQVELTVTNRGPGIEPEDLPFLFTRFFRTRVARERGITGTGIGLSITKGLVEAHGGRIWVESLPGQTTTFHVMLPVPRQ